MLILTKSVTITVKLVEFSVLSFDIAHKITVNNSLIIICLQ